MAKTTKVCKRCGREIPKDAKICPACGRLPKLPFYRRWWFIILVIIAVMVTWNNTIGKSIDEAKEEARQSELASREYIEMTVDQIYEELDDNALKASDKYRESYLAVKGELGDIDSAGEYFDLYPLEDPDADYILCNLNSDEQREKIKNHSRGDIIIVKGKLSGIEMTDRLGIYVDDIE